MCRLSLEFCSFTAMKGIRFEVIAAVLWMGLVTLSSCGQSESGIPRPRGYFRIALPAKAYQSYESDCPFQFEYPVYARVVTDVRRNQPCWPNLEFGNLRATLHLSYKAIEADSLYAILEDSRALVYKHTARASDIREKLYSNPENKVYGTLYEINGNAASALQFHLTDSSRHFLRGSLYFNASPNADSIAPVLRFLRSDIDRLIETTHWKP